MFIRCDVQNGGDLSAGIFVHRGDLSCFLPLIRVVIGAAHTLLIVSENCIQLSYELI